MPPSGPEYPTLHVHSVSDTALLMPFVEDAKGQTKHVFDPGLEENVFISHSIQVPSKDL